MAAHSARRLLFTAPRAVEIESVGLSEPASGELMVRTAWSGISAGTEMLAWRGLLRADMSLDESLGALHGTFGYPFPYGYACVGHVERSLGSVPEGSLVLAYHPHQDRIVVGEADVVVVDGADARTATLLPLVETAFQVSLDAGEVREEPVVVMGLGCVGILTAALLRRSGARVLGCDPVDGRRRAAETFGVRSVPPAALEDSVRSEDPDGVPLVVEASGRGEALASALSLLAHEGTALVASWYGREPVTLPLGEAFHRRRLQIRSTQVSTIPAALAGRWTVARRRRVARELLDELPVKSLASHEFAFAEAQRAYEAVDGGQDGLMHAALRYEGS